MVVFYAFLMYTYYISRVFHLSAPWASSFLNKKHGKVVEDNLTIIRLLNTAY